MAKEQQFQHPPRGHVALLAYDSDNDRWQVVHVNDAGELQVYLAGHAGTVLVQQYMPSLLQPGINTYIGTAWQKQVPIWGYSDRWAERGTGLSTGGAATNAVTIAVPAGYVHKLEGWTIEHNDTAARVIYLSCAGTDGTVQMYADAAFAQNTQAYGVNQFTLKEGDQVQFTVWGLANGKTAYLDVWGSKMRINL